MLQQRILVHGNLRPACGDVCLPRRPPELRATARGRLKIGKKDNRERETEKEKT